MELVPSPTEPQVVVGPELDGVEDAPPPEQRAGATAIPERGRSCHPPWPPLRVRGICSAMSPRAVPFDYSAADKREGAFVAVTAWSPVYADYDSATLTRSQRTSLHPLVMMVHRWDGQIGFVGGLVEGGRLPAEQAVVEAREEVGLTIDARQLVPLVAHEAARIVVRLYHLHLGVLPVATLRACLRDAADAEHSIAEGNAFWAHLGEYPEGRGWPALRRSSSLANSVGEELDAVRAALFANAPEGAWLEE